MTIERVDPSDVPAMAAIEADNERLRTGRSDVAGPWTEPGLRASLAQPSTNAWVARLRPEATIVGHVVVRHAADEAEIVTIGVAPGYRRLGLGRGLLVQVGAWASETGVSTVFLEVRPSNTAALALYRRCGFAVAGRRRAYYGDGEDALVLRAELPSTPEAPR